MYQTQFVSGRASLSSSACCSGSHLASWSSETGGAKNEYLEIKKLKYLKQNNKHRIFVLLPKTAQNKMFLFLSKTKRKNRKLYNCCFLPTWLNTNENGTFHKNVFFGGLAVFISGFKLNLSKKLNADFYVTCLIKVRHDPWFNDKYHKCQNAKIIIF